MRDWRAAEPGAGRGMGRRVGGPARCPAWRAPADSTGRQAGDRHARRAARRRWRRSRPFVPTMVGGAADLSTSTKTRVPRRARDVHRASSAGRNVFFGVREHGDGRARSTAWRRTAGSCGRTARPSCSSRTTCAARPALGADGAARRRGSSRTTRSALGEDGPTHQPVEHFAALRAIPGLAVIRPADADETAEAWRLILEELEGPAALVLTRQSVPVLDRGRARPAGRGARERGRPGARGLRAARRRGTRAPWSWPPAPRSTSRSRPPTCSPPTACPARVVSMPSWELFAAQDEDYRDASCPRRCRRSRSRPAVTMGWERWVDAPVVDRPLRRLGPGRRGAREARDHARGGRRAGARRCWSESAGQLRVSFAGRLVVMRLAAGAVTVPPNATDGPTLRDDRARSRGIARRRSRRWCTHGQPVAPGPGLLARERRCPRRLARPRNVRPQEAAGPHQGRRHDLRRTLEQRDDRARDDERGAEAAERPLPGRFDRRLLG